MLQNCQRVGDLEAGINTPLRLPKCNFLRILKTEYRIFATCRNIPTDESSQIPTLTSEEWIELFQVIEDAGGAASLKAHFESSIIDDSDDENTGTSFHGVEELAAWIVNTTATGRANRRGNLTDVEIRINGFIGRGSVVGNWTLGPTFDGTFHYNRHDFLLSTNNTKRLPTGKNLAFHRGTSKVASFRPRNGGRGPLGGSFTWRRT
ncbi:hypothetical protein DFH27DRAFT_557971 [Peziza echinospora]|nr:hypothetical protein DFH27DRAFT_557971 [Peziza echinospora]